MIRRRILQERKEDRVIKEYTTVVLVFKQCKVSKTTMNQTRDGL